MTVNEIREREAAHLRESANMIGRSGMYGMTACELRRLADLIDPVRAALTQPSIEAGKEAAVCERDDCWLHEKCFGHCHQTERSDEGPGAAGATSVELDQ